MLTFSKRKVLAAAVVAFLSGVTGSGAADYTETQTISGTQTYEAGSYVTVTGKAGSPNATGFKVESGTAGGDANIGTVTVGDGTGTIHIKTESSETDNSLSNGVWIEPHAQLTINGNLDISSVYGGSCFANGIVILNSGTGEGAYSSIAVNGNVTIGDPSKQGDLTDDSSDKNWGVNAADLHGGLGSGYTGARWAPVGIGINGNGQGSTIDINGNLYIAIRGMALATDPYYAMDGKTAYELATINANKGDVTIYTPESSSESYLAAASYGGTINVNMNDARTSGAGHNVVIQGNLLSMKENNGSGGTYFYKDGRINLALDTSASSWTGVVDNAGVDYAGEVNLWLQNGATWTHESKSKTDSLQAENMPAMSKSQYGQYDGVSHLSTLHGGASADKAGNLFMTSTTPLQIANYDGHTNVYYSHTGNGETKASYTGGDLTIASAATGSSISLITDNTGITMTNTANVAKVLNALASKLIYSEAASGTTNLKGYVKIADGLTSSSSALKTGDITFTSDGTGSYTDDSTDPKTYQTGPITASENIGDTRESDQDGIVSVSVTEAQTGTYGSAPSAMYTGDNATSPLVVDLQGHTLKLSAGGNAKKYLETVDVGEASEVQIKDTVGGGALKISTGVGADGNADNATNYTYGIYVDSDGKLTADADVTIDGVKSTGNRAYGIYVESGGNLVFNKDLTIKNVENKNTVGANTHAIYAAASGAAVTVKGNLTVENIAGPVLRVNGGTISTAGGTITAAALPPSTTTTYAQYYAASVNKGTVNLNTGTDITPGVLHVTGDLYVTDNSTSVINMNLTEDSTWTGAAVNTASSTYNDPSGQINLTMADGSLWTHETGRSNTSKATTFAGSNISKLEGSGGAIYQTATAGIKVFDYEGSHTVIYAHDESTPTTIIGGDFTVKKAADGSSITLVTDNAGITKGFDDSDLASERNNVSEVLNQLAQKLFYTANDGKLTGTVKIADGLTASSTALKTGAISFSTASTGTKTAGQGFYDYTPADDTKTYRTGAITESETISLSRELDSAGVAHVTITEPNANNEGFVSTLYAAGSTAKATPMTVGLGGKGLALAANSDNKQAAAIYVGDNTYINITNPSTAQKLSVTASNTDTRAAHGIYAAGGAHLSVTGPVEISNIATAGDSANGISIQGKSSDVTIDGSLKIQDVKGTRERGAGISASGINVTGELSSVTVTGAVDISGVRGAGIKLAGADTKVSVGGGTITAAEDADKSKNFSAVRVQQGQLDINMKDGAAGTTTTKITGDMYVTGQYGKKVVEYSGGELIDWSNAGILNVALTDKDSFWTGVAAYDQYTDDYGTGGGSTTHDIGELNLYLQNGATWTNAQQSHASTTTVTKAVWSGSTIANLSGGASADKAGLIFQNDTNPISVVNYSGNTTVFYAHDASNPTSITGGSFNITNAAENSAITLVTDNTGISSGWNEGDDATAKDKVNEVLNQLAQKLFYKSYSDKHLTGTVKIADGLTASSAALKTGAISFSTATTGTKTAGQGFYEYQSADSGDQTETSFTTAITGDATQDALYKTAGILKADGSYVFTKDSTTITPEKYLISGGSYLPNISAAVSGADASHNVTIDMKGHGLTVNTKTDTHTTGITAIGDGVVEVNNAGAMSVTAESTGGGQTAALFANAGGTVKIHNAGTNNVLTLRAKGTNPANVAVIKTMNGVATGMSSIVVDGLVDVLADKGTTPGANEALSAVASKIEVGGGTIKAVNGAAYAIRAYGEYDSNNRAVVNVNVAKDASGNITGAGENKVEMEGDICLGGGMDNGAKADVSVGLNTADSYWTGNIIKEGANSSASGIVNLYMGNGATWTGNNTAGSTVNATLDNATWTGYSTGTAMNLSLANGATWNVTGGGSQITSQLATYTGSNGNIFMAADAGNLTISDYSGSANVYYKHDSTDSTKILGGNLTIAQAKDSAAVTLVTDNEGITAGYKTSDKADDQNRVSEVLNKLAQKLFYTANDGKLTGTVKIADGLTASSAALKTGAISFSTAETGTKTAGQGFYDYTPVDDTILTDPITGGNDAKYQTLGIETTKGTYDFTSDAKIQITKGTYGSYLGAIESSGGPITVNADGVKLDVSYKVASGSNVARAVATPVYSSSSKDISIKAKELNLSATTTGFYAQGVYACGGTVSIDAATTISASAGTEAQGIYAGNGGTVQMAGDLTVNKGTAGTYYALKADGNGVIHANVKDNKAGSGIVKIDGDVFTEQKEEEDWYGDTETTTATVNLALSGADSSWTGRSLYAATSSSDVTTTFGNFNLWLADGATWTNQGKATPSGFAGSHVTNFVGGDSAETAGNIFQNDTKPLTVDSYSGYTNIYYAHTGNGEAAENYEAGNTVIKSAAEGSQISLITDNTGVTMTNEENLVKVLNALAGKLYYSNFVNDENNLKGYVKIADGLTASSQALQTGEIEFQKDKQGQGKYKVDSIEAPEQTVDTYSQVITGVETTDKYYKKTGVRKSDGTYDFTINPTKISVDAVAAVDVTDSDIVIKANDVALSVESTANEGYGILATGGKTVTFTGKELTAKGNTGALADGGNLTVKGNFKAEGTDLGIDAYDGGQVTVEGKTTVSDGTTGIAASGEETTVKLTGEADISATDTAIYAGAGATVTVSGGKAIVKGALEADGGSLAIGDENGMTATSDLSVSGDKGDMVINVIGEDSTLEGGFKVKSGGRLTVNVKKGGTWTLKDYSEDTSVTARTLLGAESDGTMLLNGGSSATEAGDVYMKATDDQTIDKYSGYMNVYYAHTGNGESADDYSNAGNFIIAKADSGSQISLITDNTGVTYEEENVAKVLNALAGKLYYSAYVDGERNLKGYVKLAEGLTASSAEAALPIGDIKQTGEIEFKTEDGQGTYKSGTMSPGFKKDDSGKDDSGNKDSGTISSGDYETYVMKGIRSAATTSFHAWRDNMQDLYRAADLADEDGIFAKVLAGKTKSDVHGVNETNTYKGAQVGYAKVLKNGWHTGVAFDYRDGDSDYLLGGKGDDKLYSFGLYGVKKLADNSYFRVAAKVGRVENKYDVYNEIRTTSLHGEYGVAAYGLTAEYGKTFGKADGYVTPKVQLTFAHVGGKDYTASTAKGATMDIYQDAYKSFVGRIGVEAGLKRAKGNFYGGLYLAHEFSGDINTRYYAKDGGWKSTAFDGKDTWVELVLGGSYQAGSRAQIYADLARDFGGDFEHQWKLDAGVRFSF